MTYVFPLRDCGAQLAEVVGGKATGLGWLIREDVRVPLGFAIGTHAYREFVAETGLDRTVHHLLATACSLTEQAAASRRIAALFDERELHPACREEVAEAYRELGEPPVAVRSSAISEDAAGASFAGEHETYLWIRGVDAVCRAVLRCWASLFTPQALEYFRCVSVQPDETAMGVVVQEMVAAEAAGVMFTIDPVTGDRSRIVIEGSFGLGQAVVAGEVTPDRYAVDKVTLEIRSRTISRKHVAFRFDADAGDVGLAEVPVDEQGRPCLTDDEVVQIASTGKQIERALAAAQDIEWALGPTREVHLLQTRPETVWSRRAATTVSPRSAAVAELARAMIRREHEPP